MEALGQAMRDPTSILITGASGGIGAELARAYARPGTHLALTGRDARRLQQVGGDCRSVGAAVTTAIRDVTDADGLRTWIAAVDEDHPLDLVIANAGISGGTGGGTVGGGDLTRTRAIFAVNLDGVINTVMPIIGPMRRRGAGQIAIMSSLAGLGGFPGAPAYCASKAAVRIWGEALRGALAGAGIVVTVICPGFIRTPMTAANTFPMPLIMDAEAAARLIKRRLARQPARIAFPWPLYFGAWLAGALAPRFTERLLRRGAARI
jgi:short-subunit dehydrogenase